MCWNIIVLLDSDMAQIRDRGATRWMGSVDPHFFEYAVHMWRLTPLFVSYSDFDPHFSLTSAASGSDAHWLDQVMVPPASLAASSLAASESAWKWRRFSPSPEKQSQCRQLTLISSKIPICLPTCLCFNSIFPGEPGLANFLQVFFPGSNEPNQGMSPTRFILSARCGHWVVKPRPHQQQCRTKSCLFEKVKTNYKCSICFDCNAEL